ncbi:DsbA family protein [Myxococcota bacterium]
MCKLLSAIFLVLVPVAAYAQTPTCDKLEGKQKQLAQELLSTQHPYDCCDGTIIECLKEQPVCALAWRLAENICRRVADKEDKDKITRGLSRRARSMMEGKKSKIDLENFPAVGEGDAPVAVVEYACARCPFCAKLTPKLHQAVVSGPLKGKARLYFKIFPIRNHEHSKETALAFMAAAEMGRFWEFLLHSYENFDRFCIKKQPAWAVAAGMDKQAFEKLVADSGVRDRVVASKKEGIVNKVEATPTFFINGRKYFGDMNIAEMIDVLEEEHDRIQGIEYRK